MNHLKKYSDELDELSDCLQEIFDKYNISEYKGPIHDISSIVFKCLFYKIDSGSHGPRIIVGKANNNNENEILYNILEEIKEKRPIIEQRCKNKIIVFMRQGYLSIFIDPKIKNIKEYNQYNMEDLEDYLQEIFDKYNIKQYKHWMSRNFDNDIYYKTMMDNNKKQSLVISSIPLNIFMDMYKNIIKSIPNIEERLGYKLKVNSNYNTSHMLGDRGIPMPVYIIIS